MSVGSKDGLLALITKGESGEEAQALANLFLAKLFVAVSTKGQDVADLEKSLAHACNLYYSTQLVVQRSSKLIGAARSEATVSAAPQGYADLIALQQALAIQIPNDERSVRGLSAANLAQPPTVPVQHVAPKRSLISVLAAPATGYALLLFVLIREALAAAAVGEDGGRVRQIKAYLFRAAGIRR
jgi:hypothetical protein